MPGILAADGEPPGAAVEHADEDERRSPLARVDGLILYTTTDEKEIASG